MSLLKEFKEQIGAAFGVAPETTEQVEETTTGAAEVKKAETATPEKADDRILAIPEVEPLPEGVEKSTTEKEVEEEIREAISDVNAQAERVKKEYEEEYQKRIAETDAEAKKLIDKIKADAAARIKQIREVEAAKVEFNKPKSAGGSSMVFKNPGAKKHANREVQRRLDMGHEVKVVMLIDGGDQFFVERADAEKHGVKDPACQFYYVDLEVSEIIANAEPSVFEIREYWMENGKDNTNIPTDVLFE